MALIFIKGKSDPIRVSNQTGRGIKKIWLGDDNVEPADTNRKLDLGDAWAGVYGQIKSIEIEIDYRKVEKPSEPEPELTEAQKERSQHRMKMVKHNVGRMAKGLEPLPLDAPLPEGEIIKET